MKMTGKGKMKSFLISLFLVLAFTIVASGCAETGQPTKVGTTESATPSEQPQQYKVGDRIQLGDIILSVNSIERSQGSEFLAPAQGNEWVNLNLTLENTGSDQEFITTLGQMFIIDNKGNQYQVTPTNKSIEEPGIGLDGAIVAQAKKTGWVGFEVPKTAAGLNFQYNASFFNNKKIVVALQ